MARGRRLEPGERGSVEFTVQRRSKETGRWVTVDRYRQGDRVRARCYFRRANGEPGEVCRFAATKVAAGLAIDEFFTTSEATADHLSRGMTVADAGSVWLREIERADSNLSTATLTAYRGALDRYVRAEGSAVGRLTLGQLTTANLRAFLQGVADEHGTGTAKMVKSVLSGVLNLAMTDGVLAANPLLGIRAVRQDNAKARSNARDHQRAFTRAERDDVLRALYQRAGLPAIPRTMNTRRTTADLVAFMAGTGCRIDEARRLRWEHVSLTKATATIPGTKSAAALRQVALPAWLVERLRARRAEVGRSGLVFFSPHTEPAGQVPWDRTNSGKAVRAALDYAGYSWAVPHTFRRTVATLLHEAGVPLVHIADQLGHADPTMTASVYLGRDQMTGRPALAKVL